MSQALKVKNIFRIVFILNNVLPRDKPKGHKGKV